MPYLIDGHNLIGQMPDIRLNDPNDEARLVQKLSGFAARTGKRCVVIFDHGLPGGKSRLSNGMVEARFASYPGEADDLMLKRIATTRDSRNWSVVSSDTRVLEAARAKGMNTLRADQFVQLMLGKSSKTRATTPDKPTHVSAQDVEEWLRLFGESD
ncbi:MAG: NYN domain-containing protein [Chloroflexi bacterium]|nr:NYN domain-containing protein [Chloroflexota bacterium]